MPWRHGCSSNSRKDERLATANGQLQPVKWTAMSTGPESDWSAPWEVLRVGGVAFTAANDVAQHAANWDPARAAAGCDATRRIIRDIVPKVDQMDDQMAGEWGGGADYVGEDLLKLLALPYADRPGYLAEWRPT